jgi:hypothetical protein
VTNCHGLKMIAEDGKMRMTDVANTDQLFRLIQSIPSPNAEPFKLWLAKVGSERIDEFQDPELIIERALETYLRKGYSLEWVNQRLKTIEIRKNLTDEWKKRGVGQAKEFAILTDVISKTWSGLNTREYKNKKGLRKENLRDNMTNAELILNMLAELSTTEISKVKKPQSFTDNKKVAKDGGEVAKVARETLEKSTGKPVVTSDNAYKIHSKINGLENNESQRDIESEK